MKILEIIPSLVTGGGERFVVDLSNEFAQKGHNCSIITLYNLSPKDILTQYVNNNVKLYAIGKKNGADFCCMINLARLIIKEKPDIVHVHLAAIIYIFLVAIFYRKTKYYATIHSEAKREAGNGISKWIRKILFSTKLVTPITISDASNESFEDFYKQKTYMIPNGCGDYVDIHNNVENALQYRNGVDYLFLHAGRIHKVKNQTMLVESFIGLLEKGLNARLLIAGRIDDKIEFKKLENYFSNEICYIGEQADIRSIMCVADAFCLSSIMEGMPISIIEAMSVGCIPICTPVGGCINMINDGYNGLISSKVDTESYCDKLIEFVNMSDMDRKAMKEHCIIDYLQKYSIDSTAKLYLQVFNEER